jgi:hypothetical protein
VKNDVFFDGIVFQAVRSLTLIGFRVSQEILQCFCTLIFYNIIDYILPALRNYFFDRLNAVEVNRIK